MIGPRIVGSAAPQWIGIGLALPAPGCDVSLMCLDFLSAIAQVVRAGKINSGTKPWAGKASGPGGPSCNGAAWITTRASGGKLARVRWPATFALPGLLGVL